MRTLNVGIIGIGNMGSHHFESIVSGKVENMRVTAVCDIDKHKLAEVNGRYPNVDTYERYEELIRLSSAEAVIIAVPHPLHAQMAIYALENGKNVLLEKPADITVSAVRRLNEADERSKKVFAIMFNQRTNKLFQKARDIVKNGELGELKRSVWIVTNWYRTQAYYNSGSWRATWRGESGGVLLNQAPHNLDIWQWICGMPTAVVAFCNTGKFHTIEVEDEATIYTEYANGATGVFITSTGDCPGTNRFEITGTRGKIVLENGTLRIWKLKCDERELCTASGEGFVAPETEYSEFAVEGESGHIGILQNFTNVVLDGEELLSPGCEGINELTISNAAYLSEWTGNKKIELPFDYFEFDELLSKKIMDSELRKEGVAKNDASCSERWKVKW